MQQTENLATLRKYYTILFATYTCCFVCRPPYTPRTNGLGGNSDGFSLLHSGRVPELIGFRHDVVRLPVDQLLPFSSQEF